MACHPVLLAPPPSPPSSFFTIRTINPPNSLRIRKLRLFPLAFASTDAANTTNSSFNGLVSEAVRILVPSARFDASKLKVVLVGMENDYSGIIPRTYILSHCDFTANLTLTISSVINFDQAMQLSGWYSKDDVVAEWKKVEGKLCLHIHCYVSGPNLKLDLAAELRYHIFSKEMPLVLQALLYGDAELFKANPELKDASVRVYFHSSSPKYNLIESWGPLKDAAEGRRGVEYRGL
ncbi:Magnesium dechelatase SGRL, chloroplastic [Linum perenne]